MPVVQTGSATSNVHLLQQLVAWLVGRGWTSNMSQASGSGWRAHLSKGGVFVNLLATVQNELAWQSNFASAGNLSYGLHLFLGSGFNGGSDFKGQPGGPTQTGNSYTVGVTAVTGSGAITSFQFIDDGYDNIMVIIERAPGIFRHLLWGTLAKFGTWTGGAYFSGSSAGYYGNTGTDNGSILLDPPFVVTPAIGAGHASFLRADVDAYTGKWLCGGTSATDVVGYTGKFASSGMAGIQGGFPVEVPGVARYTFLNLHNSLGARAIGLPILLYAARDGGGYSALGEVQGLRFSPVTDVGGASIGSDILIGAETWRVFQGMLVRVA